MSHCEMQKINVGSATVPHLVSDALHDTDLQQTPHLFMMCKYSHQLIDMGIISAVLRHGVRKWAARLLDYTFKRIN
jgi:hypothetical protein